MAFSLTVSWEAKIAIDQSLDRWTHFQFQEIETLGRRSPRLVSRHEKCLVYSVLLQLLHCFEAVRVGMRIPLLLDGLAESMYGREETTVLLSDLLNVLPMVSARVRVDQG